MPEIEIIYNSCCEVWEAYIDGGLWDYNESLEYLLAKVGRNAEAIIEEAGH